MLVDTDPSRNALRWAERGHFGFRVVGEEKAWEEVPGSEHVVVDLKGSPDKEQIEAAAARSDMLVIPSMPDALSLDTLMQTVRDVVAVGRTDRYRALLTAVPPWPYRRGKTAREALERVGVSLFAGEIRRREAFQKASEQGALVHQVSDRRAVQGWEDYSRVGQELVAWMDGHP